MPAVQTIYKCSLCGIEYETKEQAENCPSVNEVPPETKYMTTGWDAFEQVWEVAERRPGCVEHITLKPVKEFWQGIKRHAYDGAKLKTHTATMRISKQCSLDKGRYKPLNLGSATSALIKLEDGIKRYEALIKDYRQRIAFLEAFSNEERATGRYGPWPDRAWGHEGAPDDGQVGRSDQASAG